MAKIIEHNFNRKVGQAGLDLLTRSFGFYMEEMEEKKILLGEMVMQARLFLEHEGMDPCDFILSESYLMDFLYTRLFGANEEEGYAELVYLNCREDQTIALCQFAVPAEGEITISYQIFSRNCSGDECRHWKMYNFKSGDWMEEEEDCFDLEQVREEYDRFRNIRSAENKD